MEKLWSKDFATQYLLSKGIVTWEQAIHYIRQIPYGRNANRTQFDLVLTENKGTCSSKHALLKQLADENQIVGVKLIMAMYKMNENNTPGIGQHITDNHMAYIPEAHCYLKLNGQRIDLTSPASDIQQIRKDILEEKEILPSQVGQDKVDYHKEYIRNWLVRQNLNLTFEEVWSIRENCIASLSS